MHMTDRIISFSKESKELGRQYDGWLTAIAVGLAKIVLDVQPIVSPPELNCPGMFRLFLENYLDEGRDISLDEMFLMFDCFHSMREMVVDPDLIHCNEELIQAEALRPLLDSHL